MNSPIKIQQKVLPFILLENMVEGASLGMVVKGREGFPFGNAWSEVPTDIHL